MISVTLGSSSRCPDRMQASKPTCQFSTTSLVLPSETALTWYSRARRSKLNCSPTVPRKRPKQMRKGSIQLRTWLWISSASGRTYSQQGPLHFQLKIKEGLGLGAGGASNEQKSWKLCRIRLLLGLRRKPRWNSVISRQKKILHITIKTFVRLRSHSGLNNRHILSHNWYINRTK